MLYYLASLCHSREKHKSLNFYKTKRIAGINLRVKRSGFVFWALCYFILIKIITIVIGFTSVNIQITRIKMNEMTERKEEKKETANYRSNPGKIVKSRN